MKLKLIVMFLCVTAIVNIFPKASFAYRPFVTEDAGVAGKGVTQLEISWDYLKWKNDSSENVLLFVPIYGLTDRIELSAEIPYLVHETEKGIGDINIAGKYLIFKEKNSRPGFTLKGAIKTAAGNGEKGLGSGDVDYSLAAVFSKAAGKFIFHTMFGYAFVGNNGDENIRDIDLYGIAVDYSVSDRFHIAAEIAGNRHPDRTASDDPATGFLGTIYEISEKISIDAGIRYGFNESTPKWNTTLGSSLTF